MVINTLLSHKYHSEKVITGKVRTLLVHLSRHTCFRCITGSGSQWTHKVWVPTFSVSSDCDCLSRKTFSACFLFVCLFVCSDHCLYWFISIPWDVQVGGQVVVLFCFRFFSLCYPQKRALSFSSLWNHNRFHFFFLMMFFW